jgi:hypothetical protein
MPAPRLRATPSNTSPPPLKGVLSLGDFFPVPLSQMFKALLPLPAHLRRIVLKQIEGKHTRSHCQSLVLIPGLYTLTRRSFCDIKVKMSDLSVELTAPNGKKYTQPTGLFINNEWVKSSSGTKITSINPTYVSTVERYMPKLISPQRRIRNHISLRSKRRRCRQSRSSRPQSSQRPILARPISHRPRKPHDQTFRPRCRARRNPRDY